MAIGSFSLCRLLVSVAVVAVGCAALASPSSYWLCAVVSAKIIILFLCGSRGGLPTWTTAGLLGRVGHRGLGIHLYHLRRHTGQLGHYFLCAADGHS